MYCHNCGNQIADDSAYCPFCNANLGGVGNAAANQNVYQPQYAQQNNQMQQNIPGVDPQQTGSLTPVGQYDPSYEQQPLSADNPGATAGMVLGIVSLMTTWVPVAGLVTGIVGTVKSSGALNRAKQGYNKKGVALAGKIMSIIGIVLSCIMPLIVAAIVIPAVVGIVNSANVSSYNSDAAMIETSCKDFYAGVVSGTINEQNKGSVSATLPSASASSKVRKEAANDLTVKDALEYSGLLGQFDENKLESFKYDNYGNILFNGEFSHNNAYSLSMYTTLGDMYDRPDSSYGDDDFDFDYDFDW